VLSCRHAPPREQPAPAAPTPEAEPPKLVIETNEAYEKWVPTGPASVDPWDEPPDDAVPLGPAPSGEAPAASASTEGSAAPEFPLSGGVYPEAPSGAPYEARCQALITRLRGPPKGRFPHACVWTP
jgi:hypothetical protein